MEAVDLQDLYFRYKEEESFAVQSVNASIRHGEWIAVIGPNGSGKSTLSRLFNGLLMPTLGDVYINGKSTQTESDLIAIRRDVGMVFQNPDHQFVAPTVRDDIAFGMENAGMEREEMKDRIAEVSQATGIDHLLESEPHRLSGGQKQRVAIAGVLALQPQIMIFDEATSMLDPAGRREVMATTKKLHQQEGITIVSVTHRLQEALMADRIWYMEEGQLGFDLTSEQLFEQLEFLTQKNMPLPYVLQLLKQVRHTSLQETFLEQMMKDGLFV
ncbi:energy-coupling factor transporter ATPase [Salibacterium salarium]|uniref:Energy-coupling factor transporter ATPase n=1 Tax=Salibacterium salarium TaxID=284579 RepID=A0A428MSR6_9BACI|nr:energy-coupling factor transporter ATPase [Salibacterium salarium]RSL29108.1 energy-coupling factor transporter ATPase [Salibacterium salarium]